MGYYWDGGAEDTIFDPTLLLKRRGDDKAHQAAFVLPAVQANSQQMTTLSSHHLRQQLPLREVSFSHPGFAACISF